MLTRLLLEVPTTHLSYGNSHVLFSHVFEFCEIVKNCPVNKRRIQYSSIPTVVIIMH